MFGWIKASAGVAKIKLRDRTRVNATFTMALAVYNLIRLLIGSSGVTGNPTSVKIAAQRVPVPRAAAHPTDSNHKPLSPKTSSTPR